MPTNGQPTQKTVFRMEEDADPEMEQEDEVDQAQVEPDEADSKAVVSELLLTLTTTVLTFTQAQRDQDQGVSDYAAAHLRIVRATTTCSAYQPNIPAHEDLNMQKYSTQPRGNDPPSFSPQSAKLGGSNRYSSPAQHGFLGAYSDPAQHDHPNDSLSYGAGDQYYIRRSDVQTLPREPLQRAGPSYYGGTTDVPQLGSVRSASQTVQTVMNEQRRLQAEQQVQGAVQPQCLPEYGENPSVVPSHRPQSDPTHGVSQSVQTVLKQQRRIQRGRYLEHANQHQRLPEYGETFRVATLEHTPQIEHLPSCNGHESLT